MSQAHDSSQGKTKTLKVQADDCLRRAFYSERVKRVTKRRIDWLQIALERTVPVDRRMNQEYWRVAHRRGVAREFIRGMYRIPGQGLDLGFVMPLYMLYKWAESTDERAVDDVYDAILKNKPTAQQVREWARDTELRYAVTTFIPKFSPSQKARVIDRLAKRYKSDVFNDGACESLESHVGYVAQGFIADGWSFEAIQDYRQLLRIFGGEAKGSFRAVPKRGLE